MEDVTRGKSVAERLRGYAGADVDCSMERVAKAMGWDVPACVGVSCVDCYGRIIGKLSEELDAELTAAREASAREGMDLVAAAEGWPTLRDGESVVQWMERCWLPRPRYEDGEPVQWGDVVDGLDEPVDAMVVFDDGSGRLSNHSHPGLMVGPSFGQDSQVPIRRRISEVLGADGLPIKVGETVWLTDEGNEHVGSADFEAGPRSYGLYGIEVGEPFTVLEIEPKVIGNDHRFVTFDRFIRPWCNALWLTHTPPDTRGSIDDDATLAPAIYCAARSIDLGDDPDREKATTAVIADLLRRQRELDAKTMGGGAR